MQLHPKLILLNLHFSILTNIVCSLIPELNKDMLTGSLLWMWQTFAGVVASDTSGQFYKALYDRNLRL